jgi:hypothetical protein
MSTWPGSGAHDEVPVEVTETERYYPTVPQQSQPLNYVPVELPEETVVAIAQLAYSNPVRSEDLEPSDLKKLLVICGSNRDHQLAVIALHDQFVDSLSQRDANGLSPNTFDLGRDLGDSAPTRWHKA